MKNVKITKKQITTKYSKEDINLFKNELFFYLLGQKKSIYYIPKLISYDCNNLILRTENVGISLQEYCDEYGCDFEKYFIPKIKKYMINFLNLVIIITI